jgi:L-rhamnose-H+ transport protein
VVTDAHGLDLVEVQARHDKMRSEYKFGLGIFVSIISGVLSACFNFGLEAGKPMSDVANAAWKIAHHAKENENFLYRNNVIYVVLLWGG